MLAWTLVVVMQIAGAGLALAQDWPNRVVKIIVPFPAGGAADLIAREIAQGLMPGSVSLS
jgi:tripartite-type tricarboxylate transporter receptor subunit TctC